MNQAKVIVGKGDIRRAECDALGLLFVEGELSLSLAARAADQATRGAVSLAIERGFKGKRDEIERIPAGKASPFAQVVLIGLGARDKLELEGFRRAGGQLIGALDKGRELRIHLEIRDPFRAGMTLDDIARAIVTGAALRNYRFCEYKSKDTKKPPLGVLALFGDSRVLSPGIEKGLIGAEQQNFVRDLVSRPSRDLTPDLFTKEVQNVARAYKLHAKIWKEAELRRDKMNAILAVGQGSHNPPRLATLTYNGRKNNKLDLVLVGKGITFDSGGISIKPSDKMDEMKGDMTGAAEVLAAVAGAARMKLKVNVIAVMPLAENMPGGGAQRPGDIIRTASGITVEVKNTDAEGRLILADAIHYATTLKPRVGIVDVATLTGAATIAVGSQAIALMGNNEELLHRISAAAGTSGDRTWVLPLWDEYDELIESNIADILNTSTRREAGTIVGGIFLKRFAGDTPWAHLDIASVMYNPKAGPYLPAGPSGRGTRLLMKLLEGL